MTLTEYIMSEGFINSTKEHFERNKNRYLLGAGLALAGGLGLHGWAQNPEGVKNLGKFAYNKTADVLSTVGNKISSIGNTVAKDASTVYNRDIKPTSEQKLKTTPEPPKTNSKQEHNPIPELKSEPKQEQKSQQKPESIVV